MKSLVIICSAILLLAPSFTASALDLSECDQDKTRYLGEFAPKKVGDVNKDGELDHRDAMAACRGDEPGGSQEFGCIGDVIHGPGKKECGISIWRSNTNS